MDTDSSFAPDTEQPKQGPVYLTVGQLRSLVKTLEAHDDDLVCVDVMVRDGEDNRHVSSFWVTDCIWEIRQPGPLGSQVDVLRLHTLMEKDLTK